MSYIIRFKDCNNGQFLATETHIPWKFVVEQMDGNQSPSARAIPALDTAVIRELRRVIRAANLDGTPSSWKEFEEFTHIPFQHNETRYIAHVPNNDNEKSFIIKPLKA